jgi:hypothetical protein
VNTPLLLDAPPRRNTQPRYYAIEIANAPRYYHTTVDRGDIAVTACIGAHTTSVDAAEAAAKLPKRPGHAALVMAAIRPSKRSTRQRKPAVWTPSFPSISVSGIQEAAYPLSCGRDLNARDVLRALNVPPALAAQPALVRRVEDALTRSGYCSFDHVPEGPAKGLRLFFHPVRFRWEF